MHSETVIDKINLMSKKEIEARPHYYINCTTSTTHEEYVTERVRDDVKISS